MPELVEVENYRKHLLTLTIPETEDISKYTSSSIQFECPSPSPPRIFLSQSDFDHIEKCYVCSVERKGKLLRLLLKRKQIPDSATTTCSSDDEKNHNTTSFLYLHMGMTGRISTPVYVPKLESLSENDAYPPPHTHLILKSIRSNGTVSEIAFSDPRKFGSVCLNDNGPLGQQWNDIATDATDVNASFDGFVGQRKGIKALLLDQRAVISGVGNWIADEVLYQSSIHPDQNFLNEEEVDKLKNMLNVILVTGIKCLNNGQHFPSNWIFKSRWSKKKSKDGEIIKDYKGRHITFMQSGGRASAVVLSIQKKEARSLNKISKSSKSISSGDKEEPTDKVQPEAQIKKRMKRKSPKNDDTSVTTTTSRTRRSKRISALKSL
mmetsp:Transcript_1884/g.2299  ORF Transcript_1884/g.2299 Transcript_1884/m.2299 type:complete len:378 (-) Transcript_1884:49-1182(-)